MDKWLGKVAIVTGASSGIGKDIAIRLVNHGLKVVGCGRNLDNLIRVKEEIPAEAKGEFTPYKCDVSKKEDVLNMFGFVKSHYKMLSILINNAGFALEGSILNGVVENWKAILDTNVLGLSMCTKEAFSLMHENENAENSANEVPGHIINVGSLCGHKIVPISFYHFYCVSKFAVTAITECIRQELRESKSKIKVTQVSPGIVENEFVYRSGFLKEGTDIKFPINMLKTSDVSDVIIFTLCTEGRNAVHDIIFNPTEQSIDLDEIASLKKK